MPKHHIENVISEEEVDNKVRELANKISEDYKGKSLILVCTLKGSIVFFGRLLSFIKNDDLVVDFMRTSSYGNETSNTTGDVRILKDLDMPIEGKDVLIVEDLIDTGYTLACLCDILKQRKPASLKLCTLLDKPSRRVKKDLVVDYLGFSIEDIFVVGYGLDYAERYRNLPYIGKVVFDE